MKKALRTFTHIVWFSAIVGMFGCNDSDDEDKEKSYSFYNESSRSVIVYYSYKYTPYVTPLARSLNPGESFSLTIDENSTIYWDIEPENRVNAHQISPNSVVFTDRASSGNSDNDGGTRPAPSGVDVADFA